MTKCFVSLGHKKSVEMFKDSIFTIEICQHSIQITQNKAVVKHSAMKYSKGKAAV